MGHLAGARHHRPLGQVAAGHQQARQGGARRAKGDAVDQRTQLIFQLGPARQAARHRQADDVGAGIGFGAVDRLAAPAHAPEAAIGAEGQIPHPRVGEVPPGAGTGGSLGIKNLHAIARRHIDQAGAGIDRQRMGEGIIAGALVSFDHGAAAGIHQQQLLAGHHPQLAEPIQRHVEHGGIQAEQRRQRAAALLGKAEHLLALAAGAGEHAAVRQLHHRQGADVAVAATETMAKAAHLHRRQHPAQIRGFQGGHKPGQPLGRCLKQRVAGVAAAWSGGRQGGGALNRLVAAEVLACLIATAVVWQHRFGNERRFAVAGGIGGRRQELVGFAQLAAEELLATGTGHLTAPDAEVAAIFRHVHGHMADTTGVVYRAPTHLVKGVASAAGASRAGRHGGDGSRRIKPVGNGRAVDRRRVVEEHPRRRLQAG